MTILNKYIDKEGFMFYASFNGNRYIENAVARFFLYGIMSVRYCLGIRTGVISVCAYVAISRL